MRRLSGRLRSALVIGLQGIRARKLRTLLSMVSLFLGVLAVVVVQTGASLAERALLADYELQVGVDGTSVADVQPHAQAAGIVLDTVRGRTDATALISMPAIIGEPGVAPVNPGGSPLDEDWGGGPGCLPGRPCGDETVVPGQAVELQLTAMTGDVRTFRPFRPRAGRWLTFTSAPAMAPRLVLNREAAKGFTRHRVPAEMTIAGATATITPQFIGVVDDGNTSPQAYVRLDELTTWLPAANLANPETGGGGLQVLMTSTTPVHQVLTARLTGIGAEMYVSTIDSREQQESQLSLLRLVFLAMAGLVLLIGVAGILNVGLATVGERVEEFALRRAVGTPRSLLAGIVLAETLLTGLLTAAAAIGASAAGLKVLSATLGQSEPFLRNVQFPWEAGVAGIVAGLIAGVLGGFIPAIRAARIPIASVMRA